MAEAFGHGTGHGLGIEVHEDPRIVQKRPDVDPRDEAIEGHCIVWLVLRGSRAGPLPGRREHVGDRVLEVLDCSESGLRYALLADEPPPAVGAGIARIFSEQRRPPRRLALRNRHA